MKPFKLLLLVLFFFIIACDLSQVEEGRLQKNKIEIDKVDHIEISKLKATWVRLTKQQDSLFINKWNTAKSIGSCIYVAPFFIKVHLKDSSVRQFRATKAAIKEYTDFCYSLDDTLFLENIWNGRGRE